METGGFPAHSKTGKSELQSAEKIVSKSLIISKKFKSFDIVL